MPTKKQERYIIKGPIETTVKRQSRGLRQGGFVGVPLSMQGKQIIVKLLDEDLSITVIARKTGHGSYTLVPFEWIGRRVIVSLVEESAQ